MTAGAREDEIADWLRARLGDDYLGHEPASEDASFRRYLRVRTPGGTRILMDAPPDVEDSRPFVHVNALLREAGLHAPRIDASDLDRGLLLLEDLGADHLLEHARRGEARALYEAAVEDLVAMQARVPPGSLPAYDEAWLRMELSLFSEWFTPRHLGVDLGPGARRIVDGAFDALVAACLEQPRVFVHRDYHSRNLMVTGERSLAIIDHQGALRGPLAYDLVSLARDVYVRLPPGEAAGLIARYHALASDAGVAVPSSTDALARWVDLTGAQRHLKIAGIFARLFYRDGKPGYLADIPLTLEYVAEACAAREELAALGGLLADLDVVARTRAANASALETASAGA